MIVLESALRNVFLLAHTSGVGAKILILNIDWTTEAKVMEPTQISSNMSRDPTLRPVERRAGGSKLRLGGAPNSCERPARLSRLVGGQILELEAAVPSMQFWTKGPASLRLVSKVPPSSYLTSHHIRDPVRSSTSPLPPRFPRGWMGWGWGRGDLPAPLQRIVPPDRASRSRHALPPSARPLQPGARAERRGLYSLVPEQSAAGRSAPAAWAIRAPLADPRTRHRQGPVRGGRRGTVLRWRGGGAPGAVVHPGTGHTLA